MTKGDLSAMFGYKCIALQIVATIMCIWFVFNTVRDHQLQLQGLQEKELLQDSKANKINVYRKPSQDTTFEIDKKLPQDTMIVYNRVPKCGSLTFKSVCQALSPINNFTHYFSHIATIFQYSEEHQRDWVNLVCNLKRPSIANRHIYFINFPDYGGQSPFYINLIRDPLRRFTSFFYHLEKKKDIRVKDKTINQFIEENLFPDEFRAVPFFCGHDQFCLEPSQRALDTAITNIVKYYTVVGITEDYVSFLNVLECIFPQIFENVVPIYERAGVRNKNKSKNPEAMTESNTNKLLATMEMITEYELYNFVIERFAVLKSQLQSKHSCSHIQWQ